MTNPTDMSTNRNTSNRRDGFKAFMVPPLSSGMTRLYSKSDRFYLRICTVERNCLCLCFQSLLDQLLFQILQFPFLVELFSKPLIKSGFDASSNQKWFRFFSNACFIVLEVVKTEISMEDFKDITRLFWEVGLSPIPQVVTFPIYSRLGYAAFKSNKTDLRHYARQQTC